MTLFNILIAFKVILTKCNKSIFKTVSTVPQVFSLNFFAASIYCFGTMTFDFDMMFYLIYTLKSQQGHN